MASKIFCVPTLLKMDSVDIRRVAADNERLPAYLYLGHLERLLESTPEFLEDLTRLIERRKDKSLIHSLKKLRDALANVGYNRLTADIEYICAEIANREFDSAADRAVKVREKLTGLYQELSRARMRGPAPATAAPFQKNETLGDLIKRTEEEEAIRKPRILIVDDAAPMLKLLITALGGQYQLFGLTRSVLVDNFLKHTTPDLFLLDVVMPDLSGFDLIPIIRSFDAHKHTPIIFLSSNSDEENIMRAKEMGVCEYVFKPVDIALLRKKIAEQIEKRGDLP